MTQREGSLAITPVCQDEFDQLIEVWEASVRATHDFLPEAKINELRPLIRDHYFAAVTLASVRSPKGRIAGFIGTAENRIEMLFVHPDFLRQGIGRLLVDYAVQVQKVDEVDVNEQNPQAIVFYEALGFERFGRSEVDGQGNPFPLLHLRWKQPAGG
ncbi:GNAT family N-acetyltransferase [Bremerella sp. JC817]|uniref:GNAT family N-acetyltransferase n=1 Tax=Bremerella sp. JC817 TaxID=3231756 RepID=UPI00345AA8F3